MACSTRTVAVAIAVAALLAGAARAGSSYRPEYDYPGQGDDWYGRAGGPDPDRDYGAFPIDEYSAGTDYDVGHDPDFAVLGLDPPLVLSTKQPYEYFFRYGSALGCPADALECGDGLWCNGIEFCSSGGCASGAPPCVDGDPCTTDTCSEGSRTCSYPPVPAPAPTTGLSLDRAAPMSAVATLSWSAVPGAESYSVYRGEDPALSDLACFAGGVGGTTLDDDGAVAASGPLFYLTGAFACGQESSLGTGTGGTPRDPATVCP